MVDSSGILVGLGESRVYLNPHFANRHGLIAGATGTGKTVTLQGLAEGFCRMGVPVFMADVKGDLSGISQPGSPNPKVEKRIAQLGLTPFEYQGKPVVFWDLFGEQGHPIRTTVSDMGPLLLTRLLDLSDAQEGVLNIAFEFADDEGLLLLDLKDLRTTLQYLGDHAKEFSTTYGNVSLSSVGAILRQLLVLEREGAEQFFGEPALDIWDFIRTARDGHGQVNILAADRLMQNPRLYSTFLLWLLSELFEVLPEVGDLDKPRFVFFFDEAHLLFNDAPKALLEKIEQVVRLVRSKGVGIYFITQSPLDIPEKVLGQLGNRVQHALRAFTPSDQKAVRAAADSFRPNPRLDTAQAITELGIGEALVSMLEAEGNPGIVQRALICPPHSRIGPATPAERQAVFRSSAMAGRYDQAVDRESAHERLTQRAQKMIAEESEEKEAFRKTRGTPRTRQSVGETLAKTLVRTVGSELGRQVLRGVLGSIFKGR
jgi:DNA helicase HerA-like ATPase